MIGAAGMVFEWNSYLDEFHRAALERGFSRRDLVETAAGPLVVWTSAGAGPTTYISAGMHGDEVAGPLALLEMLRGSMFGDDRRWALCPAANPTGLASGTRENADGMDLNRDYLLQSSAEVAAHAGWLKSEPVPELFISLHEDWEAKGFYFYEINLRDDDPMRAASILEAVGPWFAAEGGDEIDGHEPRGPGWIYHQAEPDLPDGWPEAIFVAKLGCPLSFTFETPSHAALDRRVSAHIAATRAALQACGGV